MNEFREISSLIDKEIEAITLASPYELPSRKIGGKASARAVKLRNPKIITTENKIEILGTVYLVSLTHLLFFAIESIAEFSHHSYPGLPSLKVPF